jgi:hypothetical protein
MRCDARRHPPGPRCEARDAKAREVSEHANAAEDKLRQLETSLDTA